MSTLRLIPVTGNPIEIPGDRALVGRDPACEVVLNDGSVSRRHARIERRADGWAIVDQGSANGTYLDSHRVTDAALRDGQELRLGSVTFRVEVEGAVDLNATIGGTADATVVQAVPAARPTPPLESPPPPPAPAAPKPTPPPVPPSAAVVPPPPPPARGMAPPPPPPTSPSRPGVSPVRPMDAGAPPPKKGRGPLFWIATGCFGCLTMVALVIGLIVGGAYFMGKGSVDVVDQFLRDVHQGKMDDAYSRLSQDYQARLSQRAFESAVAEHPALRDNAERRVSIFNGDTSYVNYDRGTATGAVKRLLLSTSGQKENAVIGIVKEAGAWKISSIVLDGNDLAAGVGGPSGENSQSDSSP